LIRGDPAKNERGGAGSRSISRTLSATAFSSTFRPFAPLGFAPFGGLVLSNLVVTRLGHGLVELARR
jgi:hypothetical protein